MNISNTFKNTWIFTYRSISRITKSKETCNISNTNEYLLDFVETFETEIKDGKLYMYCEDEYEIKMGQVVFYNTKDKSFIIKDEEVYLELLEISKQFEEISKIC